MEKFVNIENNTLKLQNLPALLEDGERQVYVVRLKPEGLNEFKEEKNSTLVSNKIFQIKNNELKGL